MASVISPSRVPFGSLDSSRVQRLTSVKNRQNALPQPLSPGTKRSAPFEPLSNSDDENVAPTNFKRSKGLDGTPFKDITTLKQHKPILTPKSRIASAIKLVKAPPSPDENSLISAIRPQAPNASGTRFGSTRPQIGDLRQAGQKRGLNGEARSPAPLRLSTNTPRTAPAGRSPKSKRVGILSRRRASGSPFTRVDPPAFLLGGSNKAIGGFSIDQALSGTIPRYAAKKETIVAAPQKQVAPLPELHQPVMKSSWYFEIHEDTMEETLTNLMQHSTQTLDISDDEGRRREKTERGKENYPPELDAVAIEAAESAVSDRPAKKQRTSAKKVERKGREFHRAPLGDLAPEDFYDADTEKVPRLSEFTPALSTTTANSPLVNVSTLAEDEEKLGPQVSAMAATHNWPATELGLKAFGDSLSSGDSLFSPKKQEKVHEDILIWESGSADGDDAGDRQAQNFDGVLGDVTSTIVADVDMA